MIYFRIQPAGMTLEHLSEDSAGELSSLHVFETPYETIHCAELPTVYGDEVVEIEAERHWENGDVEGVAINPSHAKIIRRWTLDDFASEYFPGVEVNEDDLRVSELKFPYWASVRKAK